MEEKKKLSALHRVLYVRAQNREKKKKEILPQQRSRKVLRAEEKKMGTWELLLIKPLELTILDFEL